jgi:hypothetical protein
MSNGHPFIFSTLAAIVALAFPANAQSVISTHSGIIHFFEGAVCLGDQPLESRLGKYPSMPQGSELRTGDGRAEVLLTPGVFLRMGDHSSIRMVANDLADTQVELQAGAIIVDSGEPNADTSVTLIYRGWRVHLLQKGVYRMDSDPPRLWVREGRAEAFAAPAGPPVSVEQGSYLPFAGVLVAERAGAEPFDRLSDWSKGRGQSIDADNAITAQIDGDPISQTTSADAFTYFPMLGLASPGPGTLGAGSPNPYSDIYRAITLSQPGFNSIYLPGYTYRPFLVGPVGGGVRSHLSSPMRQMGVSPGGVPGSTFVPFTPGRVRPVVPGPVVIAPRPAPVRPAPVRSAPHIGAGAHVGHR